ncbi:helix-turn-helix transcriptional regulator [Candidatus Saccharibacteria bacterium]|nr:helix-turn-helix transcriptional regulator [Candidatus Saccharibacteria bacterium]
MYTFPELIKKIRSEAGLTQAEFANKIGSSPVLIAMVESGQKEVSKKLLLKIAEALRVHPASITPFLYGNKEADPANASGVEKNLLSMGIKMQDYLIKNRSKLLK